MESDIAPYKGLLMGLFFMTVGMEISVGLFFAEWKTGVSGIFLLIAGKVRSPRASHRFHFVILGRITFAGPICILVKKARFLLASTLQRKIKRSSNPVGSKRQAHMLVDPLSAKKEV